MFNKEMFSKFLDFLIDNEEKLNKQGIAIDSWFLEFLFEFKGKAGRIAFTYDLINELESFTTCVITPEQVIIGKAENAIDLSYPFDEFPQLQKIIEPTLNDFVEAESYEDRTGEALPLLFDLYMLQQRIEPLKEFDWDIYHHDFSPFGNLVYTSDINDLGNLISEAEEFVEDYLSGEGEYFTDAPYESLSGYHGNWNFNDLIDLAEILGDTELSYMVSELNKVMQLFHKVSAYYYDLNRISYELYQDRLSSQRYKKECENEAS
jgi:hypothetical protein